MKPRIKVDVPLPLSDRELRIRLHRQNGLEVDLH